MSPARSNMQLRYPSKTVPISTPPATSPSTSAPFTNISSPSSQDPHHNQLSMSLPHGSVSNIRPSLSYNHTHLTTAKPLHNMSSQPHPTISTDSHPPPSYLHGQNLNNPQSHPQQHALQPRKQDHQLHESTNPHNPYASTNSNFSLAAHPTSLGLHNYHPLPVLPNMHSFPSLQPLAQMPRFAHPPESVHHSLSDVHLPSQMSSHYMTPGVMSGGVEKRMRARKNRSLAYTSPMASSNEPPRMMLPVHNASYAPSATHEVSATLSTSHRVYEADGVQFKLLEQLPDQKIKRLRDEKIKAIETLTFEDIKTYNRNQLRAYCSVYGIRRKKKADMEEDMAKYAALFHPNDPEYDIAKFKPTEYADGPIPRRRVPVTKAEKEKAAGDPSQLTNALQQRPHTHHFSEDYISISRAGHMDPRNFSSSNMYGISRMSEVEKISTHHVPNMRVAHRVSMNGNRDEHEGHHGSPYPGVVSTGLVRSRTPGSDETEGGIAISSSELLSVPEMHVPSHVLGISHRIAE